MKKLISAVIVLISIYCCPSFSQNYNWITPNRTYLKMYLAEDGMFRIDRNDFTNAGINTSNIDPRTVKVYNKGVQLPIYFFGEDDGVFNNTDYFDFYGTRNYGGLTNFYDQNNQVAYVANEYYNRYSDTNLYYIDWDGANGLRFPAFNYSTSNLYPLQFFFETLHFEKDKIYSLGENVSYVDFRFLNTENYLGEGWYWALLSNEQTVSDTFSTPLLSGAPVNSSIRIFTYPFNRNTTIANEHTLQIIVNGNVIDTLYSNDFNRIDTTINFSSSLLSNTSVNNVILKYIPASGFDGSMYIDLFEIKYPKVFKFRENKFTADLNSSDTTSKLFSISGYTPSNQISLYDVKNNFRITNSTNNFDTLKFTGKSNAKFEIINNVITKKPFRIKQRSVPDLVSNSNGADYLLIYNILFQQQAEQLRAYRESPDSWRAFKSEIEDIYDIFNYGHENPIAVRNFVKYVYDNWQLPKVSYICLLGRGSLDPKQNSNASVYYKNFIPVYGNPPSDGYFSNLNTGSFIYYDQIAIGRLPAYNVSEAQTMVDKIIAYENESPDKWWKTFTFITGGNGAPEQQYYQQLTNPAINLYIIPPPISGEVHKIYRNDTSGHITFNFSDSIKNDINRGALLVNYIGHSTGHYWDLVFSDPNVLSNGNKLPIILSQTSYTGENSVTQSRGYGEKFIYLNNKGAIGFVGTPGWAFTYSSSDFVNSILYSFRDSTRRMGDLIKDAGKRISVDSMIFSVRHTINCFKLLGDPAVKLKLPIQPEFVITDADYKLSDEPAVINEPISLTIFPKNYGLYADSSKIRFQLKRNNQNYSYHDTVYRAIRLYDTILYNFKIDSLGVYKMVVTLDYDNWYPFENKSNNSITINLNLSSNAFIPLSPVHNSVVSKDSIEFKGLNPYVSFSKNSVKVILQFDTTKLFNSPINRTFVNNNLQGVVTKFKSDLPVLNDNQLYYWRTNAFINNDTSGWSKTQIFIYNNGKVSDDELDRFSRASIPVVLSKINSNQFSQSEFYNTSFYSDGIKLSNYSALLFVKSYGTNGEEASYFSVGNKNIFIDGGNNSGLNLLKVKKVNGSILQFKNVRMNSALSNDSVVTFLNTFDSTHYLMLLNAAYVPNGASFNSAAKDKLRQFGSIYCDSIPQLGYFHTWSFIGFLGANHSQVAESYNACCPNPGINCGCDHWTESVCSMNVTFLKTTGSVSNTIGPAYEWTDFSWMQNLFPNSSLKFDVIGIARNGNQSVLLADIGTNNFVALNSIDAFNFPRLNLLAKFSIDTIIGNESSALNSVRVNYNPASELVLDKNSLQINPVTKDNSTVNFMFDYHNAGYNYLPGVIVNLYQNSISDTNLILTDTVSSILKYDSTRTYSNNFTQPNFRDSLKIYINIKPKGNLNEFYTFNNTVDFNIKETRIDKLLSVEVFSDGKILKSGDYARQNPEIKINYVSEGNNPSLTYDTTRLTLKLNNNYVPYYIHRTINPLLKTITPDYSKEGNDLSLIYNPELNIGKNKLSVILNDNSDSISFDIFVSDELTIMDFYNYPNPMKEETNFIFNLAGSTTPGRFKIKVFTVSGRLINEMSYSVNIGYNQIPWDGRDGDGDEVANGTYLYKLVAEDDSKVETQIQKLVVLR